MKVKALSVMILALLPVFVTGQKGESLKNLNLKGHDKKSDRDVTFHRIMPFSDASGYFLAVRYDDSEVTESMVWNSLKDIEFYPENLEQFWQKEGLRTRIYADLLRKGLRNDIRDVMEGYMADYLASLDAKDLFVDNYLDSRLYEILRKVYPPGNMDGRRGVRNIIVVSNLTPDAWIGPDGTMVLTTAVFTILTSEDEVLALMAQEASHMFLDHQLDNFSRMINNLFDPDLSSIITFNLEQEAEADNSAIELLRYYGKDPGVLGAVLNKMKAYAERTENYSDVLGEAGSFPYISERVKKTGTPKETFSAEYEKIIANVITHNAYIAYNSGDYNTCEVLVDRNIASQTALENDYLLKADAMLRLYNTPDKYNEALSYVALAKQCNELPSSASLKQEALVLLMLGRKTEAVTSLELCSEYLSKDYERFSGMEGDWSQTLKYIADETEWVKRMIKQAGE